MQRIKCYYRKLKKAIKGAKKVNDMQPYQDYHLKILPTGPYIFAINPFGTGKLIETSVHEPACVHCRPFSVILQGDILVLQFHQ